MGYCYSCKKKIEEENLSGAVTGVDISSGPDYVSIPSYEYRRLREYETKLDKANKEIERLKSLVGCGCDLCLIHNNMACPKLKPLPNTEK
jgi:hypothetical protein